VTAVPLPSSFLLLPSHFSLFLLFPRSHADGRTRGAFPSERVSATIIRMSTVREISEAIEHLDVRDQMRLLHDLPAHLKIQPDDVGWLKAAEPAFEFWNNPEDAIYDEL
jgi:hypothetical protein